MIKNCKFSRMKKIFLSLGICTGLLLGTMASGYFLQQQGNPKAVSAKKKSKKAKPIAKVDPAKHWVDSVFRMLNENERIAQLIMIRAHSNLGQEHIDKVAKDIQENKIGGLVFFQGGPVRQAQLTNYYQSLSKVPLLIAMDAEWGLGMRLDSVIPFPHNLLLGAVADSNLIYQVGKAIGAQCKRMGVHINFAPVMDINNNPNNPVINDRSFGEDKYKVARWGVQIIRGLQEQGVLACAKHFPGHGDTDVDSHLDLPAIRKSRVQLDSLELYPFRQAIAAGVEAVMVGHLFIPAIDSTPHMPSSISHPAVTDLLKRELGFGGVVVTDALEMKGLSNYYSHGAASVQSLLAGNDLLELPEDAKESIAAIKEAIRQKKISWKELNRRVKKVLYAKYRVGLSRRQPIATPQLVEELNKGTDSLRRQLAAQSLTLLQLEDFDLPLPLEQKRGLAYVGVGIDSVNTFAQYLQEGEPIDTYLFSARDGVEKIGPLVAQLKAGYKGLIIGIHNYSRHPANDYGLTRAERDFVSALQQSLPSITVLFGNPYAVRYFCNSNNLLAAYEDDSVNHRAVADFLFGKIPAQGKLPVTVCENFQSGAGIVTTVPLRPVLPKVVPEAVGMNSALLSRIDSLALDAIWHGATPGCEIIALRDGKIFYQKSFGYLDYDEKEPVTNETLYDLASVTKICATTVSVMKLYDEGKIGLDKTLGDYLPWLRGTNKQHLRIRDVLLHQAGLVAWIPFYKETIYPNGWPDTLIYSRQRDAEHTVRVAEHLYMARDYLDTMRQRIAESPVGPLGTYVYSDNDFILLGKIVEQLSGMTLDQYAKKYFYDPLGMQTTGFRPRQRFPLSRIAPTEMEQYFRLQHLRGDVHDPGAAMFGGVSGHAGLFSNAYDLAILLQMLLNEGRWGQKQFIRPGTLQLFTAYGSATSRRGLGFDKPERDNALRQEPYPCAGASARTFGHTGFTGTCIWVDPEYKLVFVFLSNRVCPNGGENNRLLQMNVRGNIQQVLYDAMVHFQ